MGVMMLVQSQMLQTVQCNPSRDTDMLPRGCPRICAEPVHMTGNRSHLEFLRLVALEEASSELA